MAQNEKSGPRVVIGLGDPATTPWPVLQRQLLALGATHAGQPGAKVPDVVMVQLQPGADVEAYVRAAQVLAGVRYAEAERFSFGFGAPGTPTP